MNKSLATKIGIVLLGIVGIAYFLLGFSVIVEQILIVGFWLVFILVVPNQLIFPAIAISTSWTGGESEVMLYVLAGAAIIGGAAAVVGAITMWQGKIIGYKIWRILLVITLLTILWNWYGYIAAGSDNSYSIVHVAIQTSVAILYTIFYWLASKSKIDNLSMTPS